MEDVVYTVDEAVGVMKIGKNRIYDYIHAGILPILDSGGWKIRRQAIIDFYEKYEGWDLQDPWNPKNSIEMKKGGGEKGVLKEIGELLFNIIPI